MFLALPLLVACQLAAAPTAAGTLTATGKQADLSATPARATTFESTDLGHHWVFAPVLNLGVNVYWQRFYKTYGEDPLVASRMGAAIVRELQTNTEITTYKVAGSDKHFLGYSDSRNDWDRAKAVFPDQRLQRFFRSLFQAAIDSGLKSIMTDLGKINGEPTHASKAILTDLLRRQMDSKGVAVTDWEDIIRLVRLANTDPRDGQEAVLWFLADEVGRIARPVRLLKHFDKHSFAAGQTCEFTFTIDPQRDLSCPGGQEGRPQLEKGSLQ